MANQNRPTTLQTSPSARTGEAPVKETNAAKLQRLKEENEVLREELTNLDLRRKVEAARKG